MEKVSSVWGTFHYIYKAAAIISDKKRIVSLVARSYRKISSDNQIATNFFGKNKFSFALAKIERRRKI